MTGGTIHTVHENESNIASRIINDLSVSNADNVVLIDDKKGKLC